MLRLFKISGDSLYPLLKNGQRVICRKVWKSTSIHEDDIVIFDKNPHGLMIKKIKRVQQKTYHVEGTDALSIDSRNFGLLQHDEIQYKVLVIL